jgi:hypothetical protein
MSDAPRYTAISGVAALQAECAVLPSDILWGDQDGSVTHAMIKIVYGSLYLFTGWYNSDSSDPEESGRVHVEEWVRNDQGQKIWVERHSEDLGDQDSFETVVDRCQLLAHHWPKLPPHHFDGQVYTRRREEDLSDGTLSLLIYQEGPFKDQYRVCYWFDGDEDDEDEAGDRFWIADFDGNEAIEAEIATDQVTPLGRAKELYEAIKADPEGYVQRWIENHVEDVPARFFS